jgi:hypothetical protein
MQIFVKDNMCRWIGKVIVHPSVLILLLYLVMGVSHSQPQALEESGPDISLGEIRFQVKELASTSSPLRMLEIHIGVLNRSRRITAPANSIKLVLVPTETKYPETTPGAEFNPGPQETMISVPLPPDAVRIQTFGLSLPGKIPESITFDVQVNPPDGEKKTVIWESGKN